MASYSQSQTVIDKAYRHAKESLLEHINKDSDDFEAMDGLMAHMQSYRAAQTALRNASRNPIKPMINVAKGPTEGDLNKSVVSDVKAAIDKDAGKAGSEPFVGLKDTDLVVEEEPIPTFLSKGPINRDIAAKN